MKVMHLTLDSWRPHWDSEGRKKDPDGLDSDLSEDNLGDDVEEDLIQITGSSSKGDAAEKGGRMARQDVGPWRGT